MNKLKCFKLSKAAAPFLFDVNNRNIHKNHYDVLQLKTRCTSKEIKEAYIKLSMKYHPDKNNDSLAHKRFVEISDAYKVLGKPESRRIYDLEQFIQDERVNNMNRYDYYRTRSSYTAYHDPTFREDADRQRNDGFDSDNYYGIEGMKRISNSVIALLCFILATFGMAVQIFAIRYSYTFKRENLLHRSNEHENNLKSSKNTAQLNGNQLQMALLKQKMSRSPYKSE